MIGRTEKCVRISRFQSIFGIWRVLVCVLVLAGVSACSDSRSLKWTEDVLLPDGRVVSLARYQEFKGPHEIGQPPTESDYWFEFKHPDTGDAVRWESDRDLATRALVIDEGVVGLLVTPNFGGMYRKKCPDPPYLLFYYNAGEWHEESIETLRGRQITTNMTYGVSDSREEIRSSSYHLSKEQVLRNARGPFRDNKAIDFSKLTTQTFGMRCNPPYNWLTDDDSGR